MLLKINEIIFFHNLPFYCVLADLKFIYRQFLHMFSDAKQNFFVIFFFIFNFTAFNDTDTGVAYTRFLPARFLPLTDLDLVSREKFRTRDPH